MLHEDLVGVAKQLATMEASGKPRQATLRRAVSTAYYALFHALCDTCVKETVGWKSRRDFWAPITPIYRAIDHGSARRLFSQIRKSASAPEALLQLAANFLTLQEIRLRADYDPALRLLRATVLVHIEESEKAIALIRSLDPDTRLELVVQLLTKPR